MISSNTNTHDLQLSVFKISDANSNTALTDSHFVTSPARDSLPQDPDHQARPQLIHSGIHLDVNWLWTSVDICVLSDKRGPGAEYLFCGKQQ